MSAAAATYTINFDGTNIVMTGPGKSEPHPIPMTSDEFERIQQYINYLDTIKDGTNVWMLQGLNIYPRAAESGDYPSFPQDLKAIEHEIIGDKSNYLNHSTWLKVKKGSALDPCKQYDSVFWESGLGFESFICNPDSVTQVKTFGSYIDPLPKQGAKDVWPPKDSTLQITDRFMQLMGFGTNSSIEATAIGPTSFNYTMNVGCGNDCSSRRGACYLTQNGDDGGISSDNYFAGNNQKKQFLKSNATTKQKVKFIVLKEWGDKVQVIIYFLYYHLMKLNTPIMITCDMVVFMLCLILQIGCIYTGYYRPAGLHLDEDKKYYSVLEYVPSTNPYRDAYFLATRKLEGIRDDNQSFIVAVQQLVENPDTPILVDGEPVVFTIDFYRAVLEDIRKLQDDFYTNVTSFFVKYPHPDTPDTTPGNQEILNGLKALENHFVLVPFLKIKKGTTDRLTMLRTKSYTAKKKPANNEKPAIQAFFVANSISGNQNDSFLNLALKYFRTSLPTRSSGSSGRKGGGIDENYVQTGGALSEENIKLLFPADEDDPTNYYYITNREKENYEQVYDVPLHIETASNGSTIFTPDAPVFNPDVTPDEETYNFLASLNHTYYETFMARFSGEYISPDGDVDKSDSLYDTIYTLFLYESYLQGCANYEFDFRDLDRIIDDYELLNEKVVFVNTPIESESESNESMDYSPPGAISSSGVATDVESDVDMGVGSGHHGTDSSQQINQEALSAGVQSIISLISQMPTRASPRLADSKVFEYTSECGNKHDAITGILITPGRGIGIPGFGCVDVLDFLHEEFQVFNPIFLGFIIRIPEGNIEIPVSSDVGVNIMIGLLSFAPHSTYNDQILLFRFLQKFPQTKTIMDSMSDSAYMSLKKGGPSYYDYGGKPKKTRKHKKLKKPKKTIRNRNRKNKSTSIRKRRYKNNTRNKRNKTIKKRFKK